MISRFAYLTTGLAIKAISGLSKARIRIHDEHNIPKGSIIFVINHFTRIETILMPYHIYHLTDVPVWSLADYSLFKGGMKSFLDKVGAVSTRNPDRDLLIVKSLLTGEANWIIFPEGMMVKNKKIIEKGKLMLSEAGRKRPPHTGAATLALRTEFYRQRLKTMCDNTCTEDERLLELFNIESPESVIGSTTYIVPVNLTYYPIRVKENILSNLAHKVLDDVPERMTDELMTEGTMLLSGVDLDIRFGKPVKVLDFMEDSVIFKDIATRRKIDFDDPIASRKVMRSISVKIMERYMNEIYGMTTVNHDHIFASILKALPFKKVELQDLRNRVFQIASCNLSEISGFFHTSLMNDQIHLLVDDRFGKVKEFVTLAEDKKIVRRRGDTLIKDMKRFSPVADFHSVRIDNPVRVIANEAEALDQLQKLIRRVAWKPAFIVRRQVAQCLKKQHLQEYETDYKDFYTEKETKDKDIGMPYLIRGHRKKEVGVLLIHGYMAAPLEVVRLAAWLGKKGLWVYVPRLKGHGTSPDDLAIRSYEDWMRSVDTGYAIIKNTCKKVVVGGFSTGAALALELVSRVNDPICAFAICPPLRLQDVTAKFAPAVDAWNRLMKKVGMDRAQKEFIENSPENPHINYFRNPISGVREIELLMDLLEEKLSLIQTPTLVAQSYKDPVVNNKGSRLIFEKLGTKEKQYTLFNFNRHGILLGEGSEKVYEAIWNFVEPHIEKSHES